MPSSSLLTSVVDQQLLKQFGERLKRLRTEQGLSTVLIAERAGLSRMTLRSIEAGDPAPTFGSYLRVMRALGISEQLALLASQSSAAANSGTRSESAKPTSTGNAKHEAQDLKSLALHREAVQLMKRNPALIERAIDTLERWRAKGPSSSSVLWDEWSVILHRRAWRRVLSHAQRSQELRQASPLLPLLPPETRSRILEEVAQLKVASTAC